MKESKKGVGLRKIRKKENMETIRKIRQKVRKKDEGV
jgi:hypothetical protein